MLTSLIYHPVLRVTTCGQVQTGALTRVEVEGSADPFVVAGAEVEVPETGAVQTLRADSSVPLSFFYSLVGCSTIP